MKARDATAAFDVQRLAERRPFRARSTWMRAWIVACSGSRSAEAPPYKRRTSRMWIDDGAVSTLLTR